jgi:hypothetical protein
VSLEDKVKRVNEKVITLEDVLSRDNLKDIIIPKDYERLKKYCSFKWGLQGEDILHRAYLRAFESMIKGNYDNNFQPFEGKVRERSSLYYYVLGILQSACEDELLATGWSKKSRKREVPFASPQTGNSIYITQAITVSEKVWVQIEIPSSAMNINDNCNEYGIEEYPDISGLEPSIPHEESAHSSSDAETVAGWLIAEINSYIIHLRDSCDYTSMFVLSALCGNRLRLKNVAEEKGLSHKNMTRFVKSIHHDLAERTGISSDSIREILNIIKSEETLSSRLILSQDVTWNPD